MRGRLGVVQLPWQKRKVVIATSRSCGVNRNSRNHEAALRFLRFLASPEYSRLIVNVADSLPPLEQEVHSREFRSGGRYPTEDFNPVFAEAMRRGQQMELCPFVQPARVQRAIMRHLTLLSRGKMTAEQAARSLAAEVNGEIRTNLLRYASMRAEYRQLSGHPFDADQFLPGRN